MADAVPVELAEGVFECRLPVPVADGFVNVFFFRNGGEVDLIDCGVNEPSSLETLHDVVVHLAGKEGRIRRILVTHAHRDHFGGIGKLADRYESDVLVHRLEIPVITAYYVDREAASGELVRYFRRNGVPWDQIERAQHEQELVCATVAVAAPTVELDGAETVRMGDRELELIWTPGHAPGHLCAFDREADILFCGDLVLPQITPNVGLFPQSTPNPVDEFIDSLHRVADLAPAMVYPSHGRPYTDIGARVEELTVHHRERGEDIAGRLGHDSLTAWELASSMWTEKARARPFHNQLALQEALAHLQSLAAGGRVVKDLGPQETRWRLVEG